MVVVDKNLIIPHYHHYIPRLKYDHRVMYKKYTNPLHFWGAWIAEWYHTWLWSSVYCAIPWAVSLSLGENILFLDPSTKSMLFHDSIWFVWFDTIICLSNLSCELWNRKLKIKEFIFFKKNLPFYGMWGSRKTSWDGPANKNNNKRIQVTPHPITCTHNFISKTL